MKPTHNTLGTLHACQRRFPPHSKQTSHVVSPPIWAVQIARRSADNTGQYNQIYNPALLQTRTPSGLQYRGEPYYQQASILLISFSRCLEQPR